MIFQESLNKVRAELTGHFEDEIYGLAANIVGRLFSILSFLKSKPKQFNQ